MTKLQLESIAEGWIRYQMANEGSSEQEANWDSVSAAFDIREGNPELLWEFILAVHSRSQSEDARCVLAAGPLEDLLVKHGCEYIEIVEQKAKQDPTFATLLRGVYRRSMTDDVWKRVTAASGWERD